MYPVMIQPTRFATREPQGIRLTMRTLETVLSAQARRERTGAIFPDAVKGMFRFFLFPGALSN